MAKPQYPDHAGRMPDHPRYGNPSDPQEEEERIVGALANLENWQKKYYGEISGSVAMQYGSGKVYEVPIGQTEVAQKIVSRPLPPPRSPPPQLLASKRRGWFSWFIGFFKGDRP